MKCCSRFVPVSGELHCETFAVCERQIIKIKHEFYVNNNYVHSFYDSGKPSTVFVKNKNKINALRNVAHTTNRQMN